VERTFAIINPDAVAAGHIGDIVAIIEKAGLKVRGLRMQKLSAHDAEGYYEEHRGKKFFASLIEFMTSGPVVMMCLEGEGAIAKWRGLMGATNPAEAAEGSIRKLYGSSIGENATHGSDSPVSAARELGWFFRGSEIV
jgi:nucleoside-diphosphate kinase